MTSIQVTDLQDRAHAPGALRNQLFGGGARLTAPHPGAAYRADPAARRVAA